MAVCLGINLSFTYRSLPVCHAGKEGILMAKEENRANAINTEEKQKNNELQNAGTKGLDNKRYRDSSGKIIFEDPILCSQFLKNYVDIPMLKDVQPEDIEDVTERYIHMFTEERNSDVVKKVYLKNNSFYLVSLIEHKSDVDYNIAYEKMRSRFS